MKRLVPMLMISLGACLLVPAATAATGPVIFPKGPYDSELFSLNVLNSPGADFTVVLLPSGTMRGYIPNAVDGTLMIFESTDDGKSFKFTRNVDFGTDRTDNFIGQPRVIMLNDGKYHLYTNGSDGISCFSSTDGLKFDIDKLRCIPNSIIPAPPHYKSWRLSGPAIAILSNGTYRAYFGDEGTPGDALFPPHQIYSAVSSDGVVWTREPGVRIGFSATGLKTEAIHPDVIQHADGSVTMFFRTFSNQMYASSRDGLTFGDEYILWWKIPDPIAGNGDLGGDPSVVKDRNGNIVLFQGTPIPGSDIGGQSAIRLTVGKGTKYGEEVGRNLGWRSEPKTRYLNCVSNGTPSDPAYAKVPVMANSDTANNCPDGYTADPANPATMVPGPKYASTTKCLASAGTKPANGLLEIYLSGKASCPPGFEVSTSNTPSSNPQPPTDSQSQLVCYAGPSLIGAKPVLNITGGTACPPGYSTTRATGKQIKITCVVLPGFKVKQPVMTMVGVGKAPTCPRGYKKK